MDDNWRNAQVSEPYDHDLFAEWLVNDSYFENWQKEQECLSPILSRSDNVGIYPGAQHFSTAEAKPNEAVSQPSPSPPIDFRVEFRASDATLPTEASPREEVATMVQQIEASFDNGSLWSVEAGHSQTPAPAHQTTSYPPLSPILLSPAFEQRPADYNWESDAGSLSPLSPASPYGYYGSSTSTFDFAPREQEISSSRGRSRTIRLPSLRKSKPRERRDISNDSRLSQYSSSFDNLLQVRGKVTTDRVRSVSRGNRKKEAIVTCTFQGCSETFTATHNYKRHMDAHLGINRVVCGCKKTFSNKSDRSRHKKRREKTGHPEAWMCAQEEAS